MPSPGMPLRWKKRDLVLEGQRAYYSVMDIGNQGDRPLAINVTRHNTLGAPFLEKGARSAFRRTAS